MAEEQRCQEGHRLCANNCGFLGSPATLDLCSKCYRDLRLKEEQASSAKIAVGKFLLSPPPAASSSSPSSSSSAAAVTSPEVSSLVAVWSPPAPAEAVTGPQAANRCAAGCRRKLGLTGFKCRCGATFCGSHRYPEQHACTFDFKAAGREAIARANPVVKAAKLDKI